MFVINNINVLKIRNSRKCGFFLFVLFLYSCNIPFYSNESKIKKDWKKYLIELKKDSLNYTNKKNWESSQIAPDLPLYTILTETDFFKVTPTIISLDKVDSLTMIKTKFYLGNGELHSIFISLAKKNNKDSTVFIPYFDYYTSKMAKSKIKSIQYFYDSTKYSIDSLEADRMNKFNSELAKLFQTDEIEFNYYVFKNTKERLLAEGYEYSYLTQKILQNSAHADLNNNSIVVGKYISAYPHELVHLYTAKYYPNVHPWLDEGLAEYLGNSSEKLKSNRKILYNYFKSNKLKTNDILSLPDDIAKNGTSLKYDFGSLLVEKIHTNHPKTWIKDIVNSGPHNDNFYDLIESKLNVKSEDLVDSIMFWIK